MASALEMRLRIRSVKNISQVTRALEAVSAAKVRKAIQALTATRAYATKAWQVLTNIAAQPGQSNLHPLLTERASPKASLVIVVTGDRGLAGAYNTNVIRFTSEHFDQYKVPVNYVAIGRKGRDLLIRRGQRVIADFSNLPAAPSFMDVSSIGRLIIDEFLQEKVDEVFLIYTNFINMTHQVTTMKQVLPLDLKDESRVQDFEHHSTNPRVVYEYEPDQRQLLDQIIPHFTALQVYQAILESLASEHAARMMAMHSATDNAKELAREYALEYNKVRQQAITNDILDIVGGAEALAR
jgi:F-type H+-transporting ATPase subunit gamma